MYWAPPQCKRDVDIQRCKRGLEHLTHEKKLRQLGMFNLEKRRLRTGLINVYKYLKGGCKEFGAGWALWRVAQ